MDIAEALQIVIELAQRQASNSTVYTLSTERLHRVEAIKIVEDLAVNEYGDD